MSSLSSLLDEAIHDYDIYNIEYMWIIIKMMIQLYFGIQNGVCDDMDMNIKNKK